MDTLHMHTHTTEVINHNDKDIVLTSREKRENRLSMVVAAKQWSNESEGWGIERTTDLKDSHFLCGKRQEEPLMGEGGRGMGPI